MTVICSDCLQEWPRDPALEVKCPTCGARVRVKCRRPSGHGCETHTTRDGLALEMGFIQKSPAAIMPITDNPQMSLL
jgi:hypothetical protein